MMTPPRRRRHVARRRIQPATSHRPAVYVAFTQLAQTVRSQAHPYTHHATHIIRDNYFADTAYCGRSVHQLVYLTDSGVRETPLCVRCRMFLIREATTEPWRERGPADEAEMQRWVADAR